MQSSSTLSLGLFKSGLIQDSAIDYVGDLERLDIGIPDKILADLPETQPLKDFFFRFVYFCLA